jgi:c-di-GMP-binding flagellar brake protein YcgR
MIPGERGGPVRVYVRHPSEFPVELRAPDGAAPRRERLRDLSAGGLCCRSGVALSQGDLVRIRIPIGEASFEADGRVAWCRPHEDAYRVGIEFTAVTEAFRARAVEQVCHIERYHRLQRAGGRDVSEEQAAVEWIARYAAHFPR